MTNKIYAILFIVIWTINGALYIMDAVRIVLKAHKEA